MFSLYFGNFRIGGVEWWAIKPSVCFKHGSRCVSAVFLSWSTGEENSSRVLWWPSSLHVLGDGVVWLHRGWLAQPILSGQEEAERRCQTGVTYLDQCSSCSTTELHINTFDFGNSLKSYMGNNMKVVLSEVSLQVWVCQRIYAFVLMCIGHVSSLNLRFLFLWSFLIVSEVSVSGFAQ